jgi:uncharacterized OB-fold protein
MMVGPRRSYKDPLPSEASIGFWEGARQGKLVLSHCCTCGQYIHYPSTACDRCLSTDLEWREVSGIGTVESFTTVYRAFSPEFADDVPYTAALVRLDEGTQLLTWLTGVEPDAATIGMRVQATFEKISDTISLHRFRPVG